MQPDLSHSSRNVWNMFKLGESEKNVLKRFPCVVIQLKIKSNVHSFGIVPYYLHFLKICNVDNVQYPEHSLVKVALGNNV